METQDGLGDLALDTANAHRELARGTVAIYKDYLGRGPTRAVARIHEDMVVILLQDSLTKAEVGLRGQSAANSFARSARSSRT